MFDLVNKVLSEQAPSGAFYTTVLHKGKRFQDENGLVTCLVLRELAKLPDDQKVAAAIEKALSFIQSCAAEESNTAFHFYPPGRHPSWLRDSQAPRADDTALFAMTLVKHDLMSLAQARRVADELEFCRLPILPEGSFSWIQNGAYRTWMDDKLRPNRVDCVVNANIATFLKFIGEDDRPGYKAAVETVGQGVRQAMETPDSTSQLSPYHPDPAELIFAMERAREVGVEFDVRCGQAPGKLKPMRRRAGLMPVCVSVDRRTLWFSHGLQIARNLTKYHTPLMGVSA